MSRRQSPGELTALINFTALSITRRLLVNTDVTSPRYKTQ